MTYRIANADHKTKKAAREHVWSLLTNAPWGIFLDSAIANALVDHHHVYSDGHRPVYFVKEPSRRADAIKGSVFFSGLWGRRAYYRVPKHPGVAFRVLSFPGTASPDGPRPSSGDNHQGRYLTVSLARMFKAPDLRREVSRHFRGRTGGGFRRDNTCDLCGSFGFVEWDHYPKTHAQLVDEVIPLLTAEEKAAMLNYGQPSKLSPLSPAVVHYQSECELRPLCSPCHREHTFGVTS